MQNLHNHSAVLSTKRMKLRFSDVLSLSVLDGSDEEDIQSLNYKKLWNHRTKYYRKKAPHLLVLKERALESSLDKRGLLFVVSHQEQVLASLRLIQRPFEVESYRHNLSDFSIYKNFWEIGRLVTSPGLDKISLAMVVQYLLCVAGLEMFTQKNCEGLVGICKPINSKFFSKFGMESGNDVFCLARNISYQFLHGDILDILDSTAKIIKFENKIHTRLSMALGV